MKIDADQYRREACEKCDKRTVYPFVAGGCTATVAEINLCEEGKHEGLDTV